MAVRLVRDPAQSRRREEGVCSVQVMDGFSCDSPSRCERGCVGTVCSSDRGKKARDDPSDVSIGVTVRISDVLQRRSLGDKTQDARVSLRKNHAW